MSNDIRIKWEPKSLVPLEELEAVLMRYTDNRGNVTLLENSTVLFLKSSDDYIGDAKKGMSEAKYLTDFDIQPMDDGNFLVFLHSGVAVFVSAKEFNVMKKEIAERIEELKFPSEIFIANPNNNGDSLLLGLYARGKLQKDAHDFAFHKRLTPLSRQKG